MHKSPPFEVHPLSSPPPRLVFLNRCYWPDSEATGQLLTDLCERLADTFEVHIVCGQPNSPTDESYIRSGVQLRNGVMIHRLNHTRFAKRIPAGRVLNLLSFSKATARYLRRTNLQSDVLVSETDPFLLPIVAAKHANRSGATLVCYLQDIYPDVAVAIGKAKPGQLTHQIRSRLRTAYLASDRVIVLARCMRDRLANAPWSIPSEKLQVIPNWADCDAIHPLPKETNEFRKRLCLEDKFVVMHSGNMGLTQRLDVLIHATMSDQWPANAVLLLIGDGASRNELEALATSVPPGRVKILPYQPRHQLGESLSAADLHVVSMHESITGCLCPSKLYGILAAGRPVMAIASATTDLAQTVRENDLGWCCEPGDPPAIVDSIATAANSGHLLSEMGARARSIAKECFDRKVVMNDFESLFRRLTNHTNDSTESIRFTSHSAPTLTQ